MSNILGLWSEDNLQRIEREERAMREVLRGRMKQQEREEYEAGFADGGSVDLSASWQYRAGQIAREESEDDEMPFDFATEARRFHLHDKLYIVDEHIPWWKKVF